MTSARFRCSSRIALLAAAFLAGASAPALAQRWIEQGPAPYVVSPETIAEDKEGMFTRGAGAVEVILAHPTDPAVLYAGSVNGGIWRSDDGGAGWIPLTDHLPSLSIGAMALDPADPARIVAGIGRPSNAGSQGGNWPGLLESRDGGRSWRTLELGLEPGRFTNIRALLIRPEGILVAGTRSLLNSGKPAGGLFLRSTADVAVLGVDRAVALTDPARPLPRGADMTALIADPRDPAVLYAAVGTPALKSGAPADPLNGVYRSGDGGRSWTRETDGLGLERAGNIRLAAGSDGSVVAVIAEAPEEEAASFDYRYVRRVLRRDPATGIWASLSFPPFVQGSEDSGQAESDLALIVDAKDPRAFYVGAAPSFLKRGVVDPAAGTVRFTSLFAGAGTVGNPHVDFRGFAYDAAGRLLSANDGGVFRSADPATPNTWEPLNDGLGTIELYGAVWNPVGRTVAAAAQDAGIFIQQAPGAKAWNGFNDEGDGFNIAVNATTLRGQGQAAVYSSCQSLNSYDEEDPKDRVPAHIRRTIFDGASRAVGGFANLRPTVDGRLLGEHEQARGVEGGPPMESWFVLNATDPHWIAISTSFVYVGRDDLADRTTRDQPLPVRDLTRDAPAAIITKAGAALAFGTREEAGRYALLAGTDKGQLHYVRDARAPDARLAPVAITAPLEEVAAVALDPATPDLGYVVDRRHVYAVELAGCGAAERPCRVRDLGATLPATFVEPRSIRVVVAEGVRALFVGGASTAESGGTASNLYALVGRVEGDGADAAWKPFGGTLPNAPVSSLSYSYEDDVLVAGTLGRGAWTLPGAMGVAAALAAGSR